MVFSAHTPISESGAPFNPASHMTSKMESSNSQRLTLKTKLDQTMRSSPPLPLGSAHPILSAVSNGHRRPRPETSHQRAVNMNRKQRIDHILHRQMVSHQLQVRRHKRRNSSSFGMMIMNRVKDLPDSYDTDDESSWGPGGLVANKHEMDDYGAESVKYKKVIDRALRRLLRAENVQADGKQIRGYRKRKRKSQDYEDEGMGQGPYERPSPVKHRHHSNGTKPRKGTDYGHQLDELDLALLGENDVESGSEDSDGDETEEDLGIHA